MTSLRRIARRIPFLGTWLPAIRNRLLALSLDSARYWEKRYARGGSSGAGSYGVLARYKADYINAFLARNDVATVLELGCGDGNQLGLCSYRTYLGFDVSETALAKCRELYLHDASKQFLPMSDWSQHSADLVLSLDVIYHLTEDGIFEAYMAKLFASSRRFVIIYSSNFESAQSHHVRHRRFGDWVEAHAPTFRLVAHDKNKYPYSERHPDGTSFADFFVYERVG